MNQRLSDWASVAEIISGVAVVVTLVFLILSIRANTDAIRAETYDRNVADINEFQYALLDNPDALRVWAAWFDGSADELVGLDVIRLRTVLGIVGREAESSYFDWRYGLISDEAWSRLRNGCVMTNQALNERWLQPRTFTTEFANYVRDECSEAARTTD